MSYEEKVKAILYKTEIPNIIADNTISYSLDRSRKGVDYEISEALKNEPSKSNGSGGGIPDSQILLKYNHSEIPVIIELKGNKKKLVKSTDNGLVKIFNKDGKLDFNSIKNYAANGAVYYSRSILKNVIKFENIIAVGVNGYLDNNDFIFEANAYILNLNKYDLPIKLGTYSNLSFLYPKNLEDTIAKMHRLLENPKERELRIMDEENEYDRVLKDLNQQIYQNDHIATNQRVDLVVASIMAGLGNDDVMPLQLNSLKGFTGNQGTNDGQLVLNQAERFLKSKKLPLEKINQIINQLKVTLVNSHNQYIEDENVNETPIKQIYRVIIKEVIPLLKKSNRNDFMGRLFNAMYAWVAVPDGDENDVVLTPRYVADLMVRLCGIDRNSYVWDWALGSGGLLISAMNLMINDAKKYYSNDPSEKKKVIHNIKTQQLLGIEKLPNVYVLSVLNMILMGDGSSNILQQDSLKYDGTYAYNNNKFNATSFVINPPYSAEGNGMVFLKEGLKKMQGRGDKAVVIVQDSAGKGKSAKDNRDILVNNTLLASIKMPNDLFPTGVQTSIYVFKIGKSHNPKQQVKFVDFRHDGYKRTNRKKSNINLVDQDDAIKRYSDLVNLVNFDNSDSKYFIKDKNYIKDSIDPDSGCDWNWESHIHKTGQSNNDTTQQIISDYLSWDIKQFLSNQIYQSTTTPKNTVTCSLNQIFHKIKTNSLNYKVRDLKKIKDTNYNLPALTAGIENQGLSVKIPSKGATILRNVISVSANGKNSGAMFYQPHNFTVLQDSYALEIKQSILKESGINKANKYHYLYLLTAMGQTTKEYDWSNKATWERIKNNVHIKIPATDNDLIDFNFMENEVKRLITERKEKIDAFLDNLI